MSASSCPDLFCDDDNDDAEPGTRRASQNDACPETTGNTVANVAGPPYAELALSLCSQDWPDLGLDLDLLNDPPGVTAGGERQSTLREIGKTPPSSSTDDISPIVDRIVSLLLLRIVALVNSRYSLAEKKEYNRRFSQKLRVYPDLSTTTIAKTELEAAVAADGTVAATYWPDAITSQVTSQLRDYVHRICADYRAVHYHNVEHCYHVTLSANKLLDMLLNETVEADSDDAAAAAVAGTAQSARRRRSLQQKRKLFGLRTDTLTHLAFIFSALIHDADHTGITNRQLVDEADELALLYNDQSVAEQRSLAIAFSTLLLPDFEQLRDVMFTTRDEYKRFRKTVINLVLTTDIASPERTQIVKSKWKEAFPSLAHAARERRRLSVAVARRGRNSSPSAWRNDPDVGTNQDDSVQPIGLKNQWRQKQASPPPQAMQPAEEDSPSILKNLRNANGPNWGSMTDYTAKLNDVPEDEPGGHGVEQQDHRQQRRSTGTGESVSSRVSIVDPLPSELEQEFHGGIASSKKPANCSSSVPGSMKSDTLKSSFFRGRVSMGLGYLKGETDSATNTSTNLINRRRKVSIGESPDIIMNRERSLDEAEADDSSPLRDNEEEDDAMEEDDSSISSSSSIESTEAHTDDRAARPCSDDSLDGVIMTGVTLSKIELLSRKESSTMNKRDSLKRRAMSDRKILSSRMHTRGASDGIKSHISDNRSLMQRRFSLPNMSNAPKFELRLGIRRAVDLTGQPIETYAPKGATIRKSLSGTDLDAFDDDEDFDEPDELKTTTILEHLMKAADVAALLQGWDNFIKWSSRLYREQKTSAVVQRGDDPEASWYEGQIVFMDIYIMPLAKRLAEPAIFDEEIGAMFAQCVEDNRARWLVEGKYTTHKIIEDWEDKYGEECCNGNFS